MATTMKFPAYHDSSIMAHVAADGRIQSLNEHAAGVAKRCAKFLIDVGHPVLAPLGELLGLLHDLGKHNLIFNTISRRLL